MAETIPKFNPIAQHLIQSQCHSSRLRTIRGFIDTNYTDPPKTDVTIVERHGANTTLTVTSQCLSIQEFLTANVRYQRRHGCDDNSDEEWQTNIFNGELTITEVANGSVVSFQDEDDSQFENYVGACMEMCEVVYDTRTTRECTVCQYKTKYPSKLKLHMRIHTGEKPFSCDVCEYKSSKSYSLKAHKRTHTGERPYVCNECPFACNDPSTLRRHKYIHSGVKPYSCGQCDYKCTRSTHLKRHLMTHQVNGRYQCDLCVYKCDSKVALKRHSFKHTGKKMCVCKLCPFSTDDKSTMRRHNLIHTNEKPFVCHLCEYRCRRSAHLRRHLKSHERKLRPLVCPTCGWSAKTDAELKSHECFPASQSSYHCNVCSFISNSLESLNEHKTTHSDKLGLSCLQCTRRFQNMAALDQHTLQHLKKKKHTCKECNYSTDFSSSIRKHRLNHIGDYPFKCESCSYTAKREPNLERHREIHRHEDVPEIKVEDLDEPIDLVLASNKLKRVKNEDTTKETPIKCYQCVRCIYICATIRELERHSLTHSPFRPCVDNVKDKISLSTKEQSDIEKCLNDLTESQDRLSEFPLEPSSHFVPA